MKDTGEISIVVPIYNEEKYLRQCVESVLAQTHTDWNMILVDDGSTDSSPAICDEFANADPRIRTIHRKNGGFSAARNAGMDLADGEYITFLDADDAWHPQFLELALAGIKRTKADVISFGFTNKINGFSKEIKARYDITLTDGETFTEWVLYQRHESHPCSVWGKLYKREVLKNIRFTPSIGYEDLDLSYRLFPGLKSIAVSDLKLYYYRPNPNSYIHTFTGGRKDVLDVTDGMKKYFSPEGKKPNHHLYEASKDRRLSAHFNILGLMAAKKYEDAEMEARCWKVICEERRSSFINPKVRFKNKFAIIATYIGGKPLYRFLSSFIYK